MVCNSKLMVLPIANNGNRMIFLCGFCPLRDAGACPMYARKYLRRGSAVSLPKRNVSGLSYTLCVYSDDVAKPNKAQKDIDHLGLFGWRRNGCGWNLHQMKRGQATPRLLLLFVTFSFKKRKLGK